MTTRIAGFLCRLLPEKALFFPEKNLLVISDLHIGKIGYFRKNGIPIPSSGILTTIDELQKIVKTYSPGTLLFLGDLFHTSDDGLWDYFANIISEIIPLSKVILVSGNHDVFPVEKYKEIGMDVCDRLIWNGILFTHEPDENEDTHYYNIAGHIHPAVRISSKGRQNLRLPCFCIGKSRSILPAFGHFTGTKTILPLKEDDIFVIGEGIVYAINK
jgi:DNA ligase-associated metallophosphoesterase